MFVRLYDIIRRRRYKKSSIPKSENGGNLLLKNVSKYKKGTSPMCTQLLNPKGFVGLIWGTINPLTIGIGAENQWVYLICCQS